MKSILTLTLLTLTASVATAADIGFHCSNAPATVWGQYYAISATTKDFSQLTVHQFGLVEGSSRAEEEEPVTVIQDVIAKPNLREKATSAQWKEAIPFDLSSSELGQAILYIHPKEFVAGTTPKVRLKIGNKDLRLTCGF